MCGFVMDVDIDTATCSIECSPARVPARGSPYGQRIVDKMGCVALLSSSLTGTSLSTECHLPCTSPPPQPSATTVLLFPLVEVKQVLHPRQSYERRAFKHMSYCEVSMGSVLGSHLTYIPTVAHVMMGLIVL